MEIVDLQVGYAAVETELYQNNTDSLQLNVSSETSSRSASHKIPCLFGNPKIKNFFQKSSLLYPVLSQIDPILTPISSFIKTHFCVKVSHLNSFCLVIFCLHFMVIIYQRNKNKYANTLVSSEHCEVRNVNKFNRKLGRKKNQRN